MAHKLLAPEPVASGFPAGEAGAAAAGMLLMGVAGAAMAATMTLYPFMEHIGLPYYGFVGLGQVLSGAAIAVLMWLSGQVAAVERGKWKWVVFRGAAGGTFAVLGLLAVARRAPLGDVNALQCINVVVAALLGRAFLGEDLRSLHLAAIGASVVGAVLVTEVYDFLYDGGARPPWAGYALACASGAVSGSTFMAGRLSKGVPALIMLTSINLQMGVMMLLVRRLGIVQEPSLTAAVGRSPWEALGYFALCLALEVLIGGGIGAGSQLCPAATSSMIFTSVSMSLSYAAQVAFFDQVPRFPTVLGALLMLASVALVAMEHSWNTLGQGLTSAGDQPHYDSTGAHPACGFTGQKELG